MATAIKMETGHLKVIVEIPTYYHVSTRLSDGHQGSRLIE